MSEDYQGPGRPKKPIKGWWGTALEKCGGYEGIANECGVSERAVRKWVNGESFPDGASMKHLQTVAKKYNLDPPPEEFMKSRQSR